MAKPACDRDEYECRCDDGHQTHFPTLGRMDSSHTSLGEPVGERRHDSRALGSLIGRPRRRCFEREESCIVTVASSSDNLADIDVRRVPSATARMIK